MKISKILFFSIIAILFSLTAFSQQKDISSPQVGISIRTNTPTLMVETPNKRFTLYPNGDKARAGEDGIYYFIGTKTGTEVWMQHDAHHSDRKIIGYLSIKPQEVFLTGFDASKLLLRNKSVDATLVAKN